MAILMPVSQRARPPLPTWEARVSPALRLQLLRIFDEMLSWAFFVFAQQQKEDAASQEVLTHLQAALEHLDAARRCQRGGMVP